MQKISLSDKFSKFTDHWAPRVIAEVNDHQLKLVKIKGDFVWHDHDDADEVFIVIEGSMSIEFEDEIVELNRGEMCVVPKGVRHRPFAENECQIMLVEPRGLVNTGEAGGDLTADGEVWI